MRGRFVRKVKGEDGSGNHCFLLLNDPLMMDVEERKILKMPTADKRRPGIFKLICEPWADPLIAKTADKTDKG